MSTIITVLLSLAIIYSTSYAMPTATTVCDTSKCPPIRCANPDYKTDPCCGDCSNSQCMLQGRVEQGEHFPTWYPNPCTKCTCNNGLSHCTNSTCLITEALCNALNYTAIIPPGQCCPICDYGVSPDTCKPVRASQQLIKVSVGADQECHTSVWLHKCDKESFTLPEGIQMQCVPTVGTRNENLSSHENKNCRDVKNVVIEDITDCTAVRRRASIQH